MPKWPPPHVGQAPHAAGPDDTTPPRGSVVVMGARLAPPKLAPRHAPSGTVPRVPTTQGMPAPPYVPVPVLDPDDEPTRPGGLAHRVTRLSVSFTAFSEDERVRVEAYVRALERAKSRKS